ncbi:natural cytotoxicity triggering receptor 3 ligand 1 [Corvus moneduloides]|uniref:natural cytotoxicity triggering receptor 3 ligand 1 n=1 Tax=Corvus moneduloides TaxID=1196302 RepID=UPI00136249EC|nr:natural cytotoxicity triggering receptor 3 ligand 1 [Corvus moneduloides]
MGTRQSKEIPRASPLGCILVHWKEIVGAGGTENKRTLIKYCTQWWPLYKLENEAKWPSNGTLDYNTLLQLMLFLRREGKWEEVSYADAFFSLRKHPEWQRDCGIKPPSDPMVLALEKENNKGRRRIKRCCSSCSIGQRCTRSDKVYQAAAQGQDDDELTDLLKPPLRRQEEDADSEGTPTPTSSPPGSPVSSQTRKQEPHWNPNRTAELKKLKGYQEWIAKGVERAIPKTLNWSALYAIRQSPSESPSEFLDRLRDAMRRNTSLDPETEVGLQQLVSLFLGQSTGDIRRKLQKLQGPEGRNLETLLDAAWKVFSNREESYKQGMRKLVAVVKEGNREKLRQGPPRRGPPRQGPPWLGRDQCTICGRFGHWKNECPERRQEDHQNKGNRGRGRVVAHVKED